MKHWFSCLTSSDALLATRLEHISPSSGRLGVMKLHGLHFATGLPSPPQQYRYRPATRSTTFNAIWFQSYLSSSCSRKRAREPHSFHGKQKRKYWIGLRDLQALGTLTDCTRSVASTVKAARAHVRVMSIGIDPVEERSNHLAALTAKFYGDVFHGLTVGLWECHVRT